MKDIESESRFSFLEATGVIIGHGVGLGILSVPYLASRNNWWDFIWISLLAFVLNVILHLMIAELSLNNDGAQFVKCIENEFFKNPNSKAKKPITWIVLCFMALSVIVNCCGYISESASAIMEITHLPRLACIAIYYVFAGLVVFFGMKLVGICEKYCIFALIVVMTLLSVAVFVSPLNKIPSGFYAVTNAFALYGMISFALSSVMSVPTVVKGLNGDRKKIIGSVVLGTGINIFFVMLLTFITLLGVGDTVSNIDHGAIIDLSNHLNMRWVGIVGYIFTIIAMSTSLWANTLNLRDLIHEQTNLGLKISWIFSSLPSLILALIGIVSFSLLSRAAAAVQVATGLAIIVAYGMSRYRAKIKEQNEIEYDPGKKKTFSPILGPFGSIPWQIIIVLSSIIATVGQLFSVK